MMSSRIEAGLEPTGLTTSVDSSPPMVGDGLAASLLESQAKMLQELSEARVRLQLLMEQLPAALWTTDLDLRITSSGGAALYSLGLRPNQTVGMTIAEYLKTDDPQHESVRRHRLSLAGQSQFFEYQIYGRTLQTRLEPLRDLSGTIIGCIGICFDITDRIRAQAAAHETEERFRAFMNNSPACAWMKDDQYRYVYLNAPFQKRFQVSIDEFYGRTDFDVWPRETAEELRTSDLKVASSGEPVEMIENLTDPAGVVHQTLICKFPIRDAAGRLYLGGIGIDVTERMQAEQAQIESEAKFRRLFNSIPIPTFSYDMETFQIHEVNDAAVLQYGYSYEEFCNLTMMDLRPPEEVPIFLDYCAKMPANGHNAGVWRHRKKDGTVFNVEIASHPVTLAGRRARLSLATDITERLRGQQELLQTQEQLRQSQKMEAVGRLAGGIAHDFNNLLTIILGYTESVMDRLEPGAPGQAELREVCRAGDRAAALIRQLLAFSRKQVLLPRVLNLNDVVGDLEKMLQRVIGEDLVLCTALEPDLWSVLADRNQIEQVVLNLIINARDATPHGGRVAIATANVKFDSVQAFQRGEVRPGLWVELSISDTGCGMDEATQARIFEPFFTTKEVGKGSGMGLATVHGIIEQSGGQITVETAPGRGSCFRIYLPRAKDMPPAHDRRESLREVPSGDETVLLVEDEPGVRALAKQVLESCGYTVHEAGDGAEALAFLRSCGGPLDLLITDVVMPHMNGQQLVEHLAGLRPGLKVLYMSGYADDVSVRGAGLRGEVALLEKPFSASSLARKVRTVIDACTE